MAALLSARPARRGTPSTSLNLLATFVALALAGCGGGGGGDSPSSAPSAAPAPSSSSGTSGTSDTSSGSSASSSTDTSTSSTSATDATTAAVATAAVAVAPTHADAFRLLTQATMGPTDAALGQVMNQGVTGWIDAQLALPASAAYQARWDADNAAIAAKTPGATGNANSVMSQFYVHALKNDDQLRQRVAFALSQIFVVSTNDLSGFHARSAAAYMDMLERDAFSNYRTLLQDITLSPAMGQYLNMLRNQKETSTGQVPDQNFAREVMQLFSIGLSQLNADGTVKLDAGGKAIDTYGPDDVAGLSRALTGWSWGGPDTTTGRFMGGANSADPNRQVLTMQAYPQFHSTLEKRFLGAVVPAQAVPDPNATLKVVLDTLANHPNVGPFIGRQLIQRLVTSHPSPAYVGRVAAVFNNNGMGTRGDLKAVVRAILTDAEARDPSTATGDAYGKIREPMLRLTAWMRAFNAKSDSGQALVTNTDDPGLALGQSLLRSPSVFNFYRPGYVAAGTLTGARGLTMPELQITTETSVAGYVNYMADAVAKGAGLRGLDGKAARPDVQPDYTGELAIADQPAALVSRIVGKLIGDNVPDAYQAELRTAVSAITIPTLKADKSNQTQVDNAKRNRVYAAVLLTLASPEFIVQK